MYGLKKIYNKLNSFNPLTKKRSVNKASRLHQIGIDHANGESVKTASNKKTDREILKSKASLYSGTPY